MRLPKTLLLPLVAALISCGGDDDAEEVEGLISIEMPTSEPTHETYEETALVSGPRWTSVEQVTWNNAAGGNGAANLRFERNCYGFLIVFPECNHASDDRDYAPGMPAAPSGNTLRAVAPGLSLAGL
jgi:hypothetical protein